MNLHKVITSSKEFDLSEQAAITMRIRYLTNLIDRWEDYINEETTVIPNHTEPSQTDALFEIIRLNKRLNKMKKGIKTKSTITDEMIEIARNHPIENVVEFIRGTSIAFCHKDNRPSLTWNKKANKAHCFPCGKSFSAIDVLILRDKMLFIEAVKALQ